MTVLLKYPGQAVNGDRCGPPCAELLRLDVSGPRPRRKSRAGSGRSLGGDPAGLPNGRRPNDDVTDIAIRVVGGANYITARAGDGVNFLDGAPGAGTSATAPQDFPFLPTPYYGRIGVDGGRDAPTANGRGKPALVPADGAYFFVSAVFFASPFVSAVFASDFLSLRPSSRRVRAAARQSSRRGRRRRSATPACLLLGVGCDGVGPTV